MKTDDGNGVSVINGRKYVPLSAILPDPNQPRKVFGEEKLKELADSMRENGVIQDLIVEPLITPAGKYQLIDGERRWRAAKLAGLSTVPISERTSVTEQGRAAVQIVVNQQHENLTALEEAAAYEREMAKGRHTAETLYKAVGISRAKLFSRLALNRLHPPIREALVAGKVSVSVAGLLSMIPELEKQEAALEKVGRMDGNASWQQREPLSFREAREEIEREYCKPLKNAPFDPERIYEGQFKDGSGDGKLSAVTFRSRGGCQACAFRSGNLEGVETSNPNVCTRPRCFGAKAGAHAADIKAKAEASGKKVLGKDASKGIFSRYDPTAPHGDYLDLAEYCHEDKKRRTYREILGKDAPEGVMAFNGKGKLQQVWEKKVVAEALAKKGVKVEASPNRYAEEQKKRQEEEKQRNELARQILIPELMKRLEALPADAKTTCAVLRFLVGWQDDSTGMEAVMERRGIKGDPEKAMATMDLAQMRALAMEATMVDYNGEVTGYDSSGWGEKFEAACKFAGMDLKAEVKKAEEARKERVAKGVAAVGIVPLNKETERLLAAVKKGKGKGAR